MCLLFPIYGIYIAFTDGVSKSYLAELAPKDQLATVFGAQQMVIGLASFFASLMGGWLWQIYGPATTFWFGSIGAILALGIMLPTANKKLVT
jgi:MFS family permease